MNKKEKIYSEAGGHTFFVPVEEGFKVSFLCYLLFFYNNHWSGKNFVKYLKNEAQL